MTERTIAELVAVVRGESDRVFAAVGNPFRLRSIVDDGASQHAIEAAWAGTSLPTEVEDLWLATRSGRLFVDIDYGQWGLELLDPEAARSQTVAELDRRPADIEPGDVVIGAFLGDLDVVVVDASGAVWIALPLDPRSDWYQPAPSLTEFLGRYIEATGNKFWE